MQSYERERRARPPERAESSTPATTHDAAAAVAQAAELGGTAPGATSAVRGQAAELTGAVQLAGHADPTAGVHAAAAAGLHGTRSALPFAAQIQTAFGDHDVSAVQAYTGPAAQDACARMGAEAYASGERVVFGGAPDLHTAAHEAAHVVQQRAGVSLDGGVGRPGDRYEQHADAVADAVVQGKSAEGLLDRMTGGSTRSDAVQRQAVQMAAPIVLLGMTAADLAGVVGAVTGVATAVGAAAAKQNNKTGQGAVMKLNFSKNYLMGPVAQAQLELIAKALYFEECARLMKPGKTQAQISGVALTNIKALITKTLDQSATVEKASFVENGAGGQTRVQPWGEAIITLHSGVVVGQSFSSTIYATAKKHGLALVDGGDRFQYVKSCLVDYKYKNNPGIFSNDDIFVRGQDINWSETAKGEMQITATVAYDFDGDTVYNKWAGKTAITPDTNPSIGKPTRIGPKDPDD